MILSFLFFKNYVFILNYVFKKYFYLKIFFKKHKMYRNTFTLEFIKFINIFKFFFNAYYFNEIYNSYIYKFRNLGYILFKNLDKGIIEWVGPLLLVKNIQ